MISNPDEARMLLNKWRSESLRVVVFATTTTTPRDFALRLEGRVTRVGEEVAIFESGDNFIMFSLAGSVGYEEAMEISDTLAQLFDQQRETWKSILYLAYKNGTLLAFCTKE